MGANKVFFFKDKPSFNSPLLYRLLKSSDVEPYSHSASYWALLPYSKKGVLLKEDILKEKYPVAYQYLLSHKDVLINRRSRFAQKHWYTLFGIGDYTFAPYKVVWRGLGASQLQACLVEKGIPNQAMHCYFSTQDLDEGHYLCAVLNQPEYNQQLLALNEAGAKSFGQPSSIHQLKIAKYDNGNPAHQELVAFSKEEHRQRAN